VGRWSLATYGDHRITVHGVTRRRATCAAGYAASATDKWAPAPFHNFNDFQSSKLWNLKRWPFSCLKFKILWGDCLKDKEQLHFLSQLQIPSGFQVINFGTNSNLNLPWILKGFKHFSKNLINSLKFYIHMIYLNMNFCSLTCIQILDVPLQMVNGHSLIQIQKSWPLKDIVLTITSRPLFQTIGIILPSSWHAYTLSQNQRRYWIS
jgi:hypothetical protein